MSIGEKTHFLKGKNILFIGQVFYDYHLKIISQLEDFGARVTFFENRIFLQDKSVSNGLMAFLRRTFRPNEKQAYAQEILNKTKSDGFDYLFCIGGFSITDTFVNDIRKNNPNVQCIMYLWDSFNVWNYKSISNGFDRVFSFDPLDCQIHEKLRYLPLFYTSEFGGDKKNHMDIDLLYIGSVGAITLDRYYILKELGDKAKNLNLNIYFYLFFAKVNPLKRFINNCRKAFLAKTHYLNVLDVRVAKNSSLLQNRPLSRHEVADLMMKSKCVIDIPVKGQSGLTIRTIESLASGKKLLTTNEYIAKEPFYNQSMIRVLDQNFPIDKEFLNGKNKKVNLDHLKLENWIKTIFANVLTIN